MNFVVVAHWCVEFPKVTHPAPTRVDPLRPFCAKLVGYRTLRQHLYRSVINSTARLRPDDYATTTPIAKPNSICLTNYLGPGVDGFGLASKLAKPNALLEQIWNTLLRSVLSAHLRNFLQRIDARPTLV
jgi:hypothetical protein